jgi:hypothetical protein
MAEAKRPQLQQIRVFLSSPGDVAKERELVQRLIKNELSRDPAFRGRVTFEVASLDDLASPSPMPAGDAAVRQNAEAVQRGGRATGETLPQNAEVGADVAHRSAQAVAEALRQIAQDAAQRFEEVSRKLQHSFTKPASTEDPVQRPAQVGSGAGGGDDALEDLLGQEAAEFKAAAGRVAALAGAAVKAAKAGNDRIEENNAQLEAALAAFQSRG